MVLDFLVFCAVGKLLMFILRKFPPTIKAADKIEFIRQLVSCDLCLGVWVYTVSSFVFGIYVIEDFYFPVISELITGSIASFMMWLFAIGWQEQFGIIEVVNAERDYPGAN